VDMLPLSMDFEQILEQWEEGRRQAAAKRGKGFPPGTGRGGGGQRKGDVDMDALLERYPPPAGEDGKPGCKPATSGCGAASPRRNWTCTA
jgi:hypothetical protein